MINPEKESAQTYICIFANSNGGILLQNMCIKT